MFLLHKIERGALSCCCLQREIENIMRSQRERSRDGFALPSDAWEVLVCFLKPAHLLVLTRTSREFWEILCASDDNSDRLWMLAAQAAWGGGGGQHVLMEPNSLSWRHTCLLRGSCLSMEKIALVGFGDDEQGEKQRVSEVIRSLGGKILCAKKKNAANWVVSTHPLPSVEKKAFARQAMFVKPSYIDQVAIDGLISLLNQNNYHRHLWGVFVGLTLFVNPTVQETIRTSVCDAFVRNGGATIDRFEKDVVTHIILGNGLAAGFDDDDNNSVSIVNLSWIMQSVHLGYTPL